MTILPLTYLPTIEWMAHIVKGDAVIDIGENYIKRTHRNRTVVMSANGVLPLSVHVKDGNRPRTPMQSIRVDYSKRWQHQHWMAILSAYKSSPYFDHFAPMLQQHYLREYDHLWELNLALVETILKLIGARCTLNISHEYITAGENDLDLRAKGGIEGRLTLPHYTQVFSDREPFAPNLSILDLLLCEGLSTLPLLKKCSPKQL